jgi:hypothetical protein
MDNKYIYGRNIWCKYICGKYILPLEVFLELKHCEAHFNHSACDVLRIYNGRQKKLVWHGKILLC